MNKQELKDIEWLKREIDKSLWKRVQDCTVTDGGRTEIWNDILYLFNQLKEPETLSKEWINEQQINELDIVKNAYGKDVEIAENTNYVDAKDLQNLLVPKQEKPVIPSFVADFVTWTKDWTLSEIFDDEWLYEAQDDVAKWLYDNDKDTNQERELMLVTARSGRYEIEEEPKYVVELPNPNNDKSRYTNTFLNKNKGKVFIDSANLFANDISKYTQFALTEQEIKDYDERYFQFAVPVEEVDTNG